VHHDLHHSRTTCNYGARWLDEIFGTVLRPEEAFGADSSSSSSVIGDSKPSNGHQNGHSSGSANGKKAS